MILCNYMRLKCGDWGEFVVFGGVGILCCITCFWCLVICGFFSIFAVQNVIFCKINTIV